jgi:hypothetical protein
MDLVNIRNEIIIIFVQIKLRLSFKAPYSFKMPPIQDKALEDACVSFT